MGRTIHFTIQPDKPFTDGQINKMKQITMKYNSGKFEDVWTCENFWCDPYSYYNNWDDPKNVFKGHKRTEFDGIIDKRYTEIFKTNRNHAQTSRQLHKEGYILFFGENPKKETGGFCKVQGNEYNSLIVYLALIDISKAIPNAGILIRDEGEFLLCDVKMRNGKAWPNLDEVKDDIYRYAGTTLLNKPHFLSKLKELKGLHPDIAKDLGFKNSYDERMLGYLDETLRNLKIVIERVKPEFDKRDGRSNYFCIHNLMNPPGYDPFILTRADQVDVAKFAKYKMKPETMMDGFSGEGFGLADPEKSIKLGQTMTDMVKQLVDGNGELQVLGEE